MLNIKSGVKVSLENSGAQLLELETTCGTLAQKFDHLIQVKAGSVAVNQTFARAEDLVSNHDLVGRFCVLASAWAAHSLHFLRVDV